MLTRTTVSNSLNMFAVTPFSSDAGEGKVTQSVNLVSSSETGKVPSLSVWRDGQLCFLSVTVQAPPSHRLGAGYCCNLSSCGGGLAGTPVRAGRKVRGLPQNRGGKAVSFI